MGGATTHGVSVSIQASNTESNAKQLGGVRSAVAHCTLPGFPCCNLEANLLRSRLSRDRFLTTANLEKARQQKSFLLHDRVP